ncbi:MAG TPA: CRTAC1 family protein [Polyangia bacterium]|jgi:hypothetical protein
MGCHGLVALAGLVLLASAGCGSGGTAAVDAGPDAEAPPPAICKTPPALPEAGPFFRDVTAAVGVGPEGLAVVGNRLASGDLDGDGYPDLIVHTITANTRDDPENGTFQRRVLLNRPDPAGGAARVFVDATVSSRYGQIRDGGGTLGRVANFAVFADVNNDGRLDLFSGTNVDPSKLDPGDRSELLLGDGAGAFDLAAVSDIAEPQGTGRTTNAATFLDYDRDGNIDVYVGYWYQAYGYSYASYSSRLFRGHGDGTFTDVTESLGLLTKEDDTGYDTGAASRPAYGVTACDVDGDGWTDLLVSAYGRQWNMLWRNEGGAHFTDVGRDVGFAGDANLDFTDNEFYRCYCKDTGACTAPNPRIVCRDASNNPTYAWTPGVDDQPWRLNGNTFTTLCADLDNDGRLDLHSSEIHHWHIGNSADSSEILFNRDDGQGGFTLARPGREATGLTRTHVGADWNEGDIYAAAFDFDNDGQQDLYQCSSDYPGTAGVLFRQITAGQFQDVTAIAGAAHERAGGITVMDLDGDGDLDLVLGSATARCGGSYGTCPYTTNQVYVFENLVGQDANLAVVRLEGAAPAPGGANRAGIGARVVVEAGGARQVREISGGYGHNGIHNGTLAHFGLGAACTIDRLEVHWPNAAGTVEVFEHVQANYRVVVREGAGRVHYEPLGP